MIYLKKGQTLFDNPGMVVYDPTGYYDDGTSVICAPVFLPEEPACRYEAKYIAYGGIVYSISNEEELLKHVLEMDPASLLGKDSKQVAIDKVTDAIVTQGTAEVTEEVSKIKEEKELEAEPEQVEKTPATSPPADILSGSTSTTTPPIIDLPQTPTASTTAPTIDLPPTTTPPEELIPQNATSTSPVNITPPDVLSSDTSTTVPSEIITPVETIIESVISLTK